MSKTRSLVTIIIFLLITNVGMLLFFVFSSKPSVKKEPGREQGGGSMYNSLQKEVGFSTTQLDRYQALRKEQRDIVRPLFGELRAAKKDFYDLLYADTISDSLVIVDADSIAQKQKRLDLQMFRYFKNIRNICTPDQLQKFDSTVNKVVIRMVGRSGKGNHDNKK
jgi:Spy/CpxP family protein refolding chaperone